MVVLRIRKARESIVMLLLVALCGVPVRATSFKDTIRDELDHTAYLNNLDEMLNLWYVQTAIDSASVIDEMAIDSANIVSEYPDSVYMRRLASMNSLIDLPFNSVVRNYINVYTQRRKGQVCVMLGLAEYYFPIFEAMLDKYQIPLELRVLPVIESALNPRAVSRVGATGLWQFMYATGRRYGMTINSYVDERRDVLASTEAAARYLRDLYGIYQDWTLVIAAYNCGPGNVNKAIRRAGGKRTYWDIYYYLPKETLGYVPAFIAASYIMEFYAEHGITPCPMEFSHLTDTVNVKGKIHLQQIADVLELPIKQLRDLNPQYKHDLLPSNDYNSLRLPFASVGDFIDREAEIKAYKGAEFLKPMSIKEPAALDGVPYYTVQGGGNAVRYKVRSGDVLGSIAKRYHVTVEQLRQWNGIRGNMIKAGQTLLIYSK